jgi:hypothetical protein
MGEGFRIQGLGLHFARCGISREGIRYERGIEEIVGVDNRPHGLGSRGPLWWPRMAGNPDSGGHAGMVRDRASVAERSELTSGVRIER